MIGIFFFYRNKLYTLKIYESRVSNKTSEFIDSDFSHNDMFESLRRKLGIDVNTEYFDIPRGRVLYSIKDRRYRVYLTKSINSLNIQKLIIKCFILNVDDVVFLHDEHYEKFEI